MLNFNSACSPSPAVCTVKPFLYNMVASMLRVGGSSPGTLHHVIVRGIEKRRIVSDDQDRENFVARMGALCLETKTTIFAWALMANHAHILLKSGPGGISTFMRRLLSGYAISYNLRHQRHGHLFQNRYKSIVCSEAGRKTKHQFTTMELLEKAEAAMDAYRQRHDLEMDLICSGSRAGRIPKHRAALAIKLVTEMGLSMAETGRQLGLSTSGVAQILRRR